MGNEIKILENTFRAIRFEPLKISLAKIRKLQVWIETDLSLYRRNIERMNVFHCKWFGIFLEAWMFYYSECCPYKWTIVDVLFGKNFLSTVEMRKLRLSQFCLFFLYVSLPADPNCYCFKFFIYLSLFLFMIAKHQKDECFSL